MELKLGFSYFGPHGPYRDSADGAGPRPVSESVTDLSNMDAWMDYLRFLRQRGVTAEDLLLDAHVPTKVSALWFTGNFAPVPAERRRVRDAMASRLSSREA
jgi:hypothetical protein